MQIKAALNFIVVTVCVMRLAPAQDTAKDIDSLKPLINGTTIVVAQFDPNRLAPSKERANDLAANSSAQPLLDWFGSLRSTLGPIADDRLGIIIDVPFSQGQVPIRFMAKKSESVDLAKINASLAALRFSPAVAQGDWLVTTPAGKLAESNKLLVGADVLPVDEATWRAAWSAMKDLPARVLVVPPAYIVKSYEELLPRLPDGLGGLPTSTLTEGVQWIAIGFDPANLKLQFTIQSKNAAAAERLAAELPKLMVVLASSAPLAKFKAATDAIKFDKPVVKQDRIEVVTSNVSNVGSAAGAMVQVLGAIIDPLNYREKQNRLKQLGLAIHNYVSDHKTLPPDQAARRADGSSNLSWRVHILPYLDQQQLYSEFRLNERWDSDHNRKLIEKMPDVFSAYPSLNIKTTVPRGYTTFLGPVGEGTLFGGNKPVTFSMVTDGTSNTILFVEVKPERAVPWTAPLDYDFPVADPANGLAIGQDGQFLCAIADGSVVSLPANMSKENLLRFFQMNDGHVVER